MLMEVQVLMGVFPYFLKKTADPLSSKIALILHKCTRADNFSTCWWVGIVSPCPNMEGAVLALLIPIQLQTLLFYLTCLNVCWPGV